MNNTLAQKRSSFALKEIEKLIQQKRDKFGKLVAGLPATILQNGFGQSLAFLLSKANKGDSLNKMDEHFLAFDILIRWLNENKILCVTEPSKAMKELSNMPQGQYLRAQDEAMRLLEWVKRYANAGLFSD